jgi:uncharacterized protein YecT (DUF1311 family)
MPNNDFNPDLTKLDGDYQVLTELHGEGDSRTYLARHLRLNRDVTINVFCVADGDDIRALKQFAADTRVLTDQRHEHIVPVIEGIWLDDRTFATVRARVRGATLDQTLSASGPMSIARVAATVREIANAVAWARDTGIAQRNVVPWDVVFQQGSGRVLLSFEPGRTAVDAMRTECDDAQTIRRLTIELLSGEIDRSVSAHDVPVPRSIPAVVADALAAIRHCTPRTASSTINALLNALDYAARHGNEKTQIMATPELPPTTAMVFDPPPPAERVVPPVVERSADAPRGMPVVTSVPHRRRVPPGESEDAVIIAKPSFGFNARLATAIVVIAAAGVAGFVLLNRDRTSPPTVATAAPLETGTSAAGEVALHPTTPAPPAIPSVDSTSTRRRTLTPPARMTSTSRDSTLASTKRRTSDSAVARRKPAVLDSVAEAERQFKRDSAADVMDPCLSSDSGSQHRCLMDAIDKNDRELNTVYTRLIAALRQRSGAASADPDPDEVNVLRVAQRKWVDARDAACRGVGEAPLYAKSRASCFAQKSSDRLRELRRQLNSIPPTH